MAADTQDIKTVFSKLFKIIVTFDPGSKPYKKICSPERQAKIRGKNNVKFRTSNKRNFLCAIYWYIARVTCTVIPRLTSDAANEFFD